MAEHDAAEAIFGAADGATSALGVIVAELAAGNHRALLTAAVGMTVAATISMGGSDYLAYNSRRRALVMGLGTLVGCLAPVLPFAALNGTAAEIACAGMTALVVAAIASVRRKSIGWLRAAVQSAAILGVAAGATVAVTLALGAAG